MENEPLWSTLQVSVLHSAIGSVRLSAAQNKFSTKEKRS